MKVRDSGMPDESTWEGFFAPRDVLSRLGLTAETTSVVDLGCGYGTFTIPAATLTPGVVHAFDIEPEMVRETGSRADIAGLVNVKLHLRDFVADGTGLPADSIEYVMLFNILHAEAPERLLSEAHRILAPGGKVAVIHWVGHRPTPRGPALDIRPSPEDCRRWMADAGFAIEGTVVDLPPYHFGIVGRRA